MSGAPSTNGPSPDATTARGQRVLVTGAAGFIGSHLCDRLLDEGYHVWGLDNFNDSYDPARKRENLGDALEHPSMHLVEGDIRDRVLLDGLMSDVEFDTVVHLAARCGGQASIENPLQTCEVNFTGTLGLLEAMRRHSVQALVFVSSASVYGDNTESPRREDASADRPLTPYAASKRAGEMLCHTYHHQHSLTVHCLRFSTVFGPRKRPDSTLHELLTRHLEDAEDGAPLHQLEGENRETRDYVYVDDVVGGITLSIERTRKRKDRKPEYQIIYLGGTVTLGQHPLSEKLSEAMGLSPERAQQNVEREAGSGKNGNPATPVRKKAADLLGYSPTVSLDEGLAELTEWLRARRSRRQE